MSVKCTVCGKTWSDDTEKCPYCGALIEKKTAIEYKYAHKRKDYKFIGSVVCNIVLLMVVIILVGFYNKQKKQIFTYKNEVSTLEIEKQRIQDEYDKLVENKSDNNADNENIAKVKEYYKDYENWSFAETGNETHKSLIVSYYEPIEVFNNDNTEILKEAGALMAQMSMESWFDYDYVFWDMWCDEAGKVTSFVFDVSDEMNLCQEYEWYGPSSNIQSSQQQETDSADNLLYEDDKVRISFAGINEKGVVFWLENLTDINITVQADSVAINGISTSGILMSDDVAPKSKGKIIARCDDFSSVGEVETVSGQLRIIDFNDSFKTYSATFTNVEIN